MKKRTMKLVLSIVMVMTMIFALSVGAFMPAQAATTKGTNSKVSVVSPSKNLETTEDKGNVAVAVIIGVVLVGITVGGSIIYFKKKKSPISKKKSK